MRNDGLKDLAMVSVDTIAVFKSSQKDKSGIFRKFVA